MPKGLSAAAENLRAVSPLAKRIVLSWIASDVVWAALFVYVLRREQD